MIQRWTLPVPPSANHLWEGTGRRCRRSRRYEDWLLECLCRMGPVKLFFGPVEIRITIRGGKGFPESRDADNAIKAVADLLRHKQVLRDDTVRDVRRIVVEYIPPESEEAVAECVVVVESQGSSE
jgi:Holliday junction resolvase RusA-like endonuclease